MLKNSLITAYRNFRKNKAYTLINLMGLAIGIALSLLIFLYVQDEYRVDQHIIKKDRIYRLANTWAVLPSLPGHAIAQESKVIDKVARLNVRDFTLNWKNNSIQLTNFCFTDSTFFSIFNFEFIAGDPASALKVTNSIVLTESYAKNVFGKKNPLNELVLLDNQYKFVITGIIKDPVFFHLPFNAIGTISSLRKIYYEQVLEQYDSWNYYTYLLAKPGFSKDELTTQVKDLLKKYGYNSTNTRPFQLTNLNDLYFARPLEYEGINLHGNKQVLYILITISIFILIIAAINFINLTTARGSMRSREVGIRKVAGSLRKQLLYQFILETVMIVLGALFLACLMVESISPLFCNLIGKNIQIHTLYSYHVFVIIIIMAILFGSISGLYPALYLSSFKPINILKGKLNGLPKSSFLREGLIVFQLIVSITLIIAAFQVFRQLNYMNQASLGFNKDYVVYLKLNDDLKKQLEPFKMELLKQSGIRNASFSSNFPGKEWGNYGGVTIDGTSHFYKVNSVDPDYFETLGLELIEGRNFSRDMKGDYNSTIIVNETAIKQYQLSNVIGKYATRLGNGSNGTVIGIVKDFHYQSLHHSINPVLFYFDKDRYNYVNLKISSKNIKLTISKIEHLWYSMCPVYPFEYHFLDEAFDEQYKSDDRFGSLIGYASMLAIVIACLGILGLAAFSTEQRTKEIGIRKVNGATTLEILILLSKDFTKWVIIAFIVASPIAWYAMNKWLENFAFKTNIAWWIFLLAGFITYLIALLTISWLSFKAATRNPVESLRYE